MNKSKKIPCKGNNYRQYETNDLAHFFPQIKKNRLFSCNIQFLHLHLHIIFQNH